MERRIFRRFVVDKSLRRAEQFNSGDSVVLKSLIGLSKQRSRDLTPQRNNILCWISRNFRSSFNEFLEGDCSQFSSFNRGPGRINGDIHHWSCPCHLQRWHRVEEYREKLCVFFSWCKNGMFQPQGNNIFLGKRVWIFNGKSTAEVVQKNPIASWFNRDSCFWMKVNLHTPFNLSCSCFNRCSQVGSTEKRLKCFLDGCFSSFTSIKNLFCSISRIQKLFKHKRQTSVSTNT